RRRREYGNPNRRFPTIREMSSGPILHRRPKDKPFFLMCHHKAPHRPWVPDEKHRKDWENVKIPEPETFNDDYSTRCDAAREATMRIDKNLTSQDLKIPPPEGLSEPDLKKWKYQRYLRDYLACVASVDDNIGRAVAQVAL